VNELVLAYPGSAMDDGSSLCVDGVAVGLTTPDALPAIR
jgi:hypothetical protein